MALRGVQRARHTIVSTAVSSRSRDEAVALVPHISMDYLQTLMSRTRPKRLFASGLSINIKKKKSRRCEISC